MDFESEPEIEQDQVLVDDGDVDGAEAEEEGVQDDVVGGIGNADGGVDERKVRLTLVRPFIMPNTTIQLFASTTLIIYRPTIINPFSIKSYWWYRYFQTEKY